jgi:hypothetical protein
MLCSNHTNSLRENESNKKKGLQKMKKVVYMVAVFFMAMATQAHAALDLTGVAIDTTDFETIAVFVIGALVVFWGIRKGIQLLSGSGEVSDSQKEDLYMDESELRNKYGN